MLLIAAIWVGAVCCIGFVIAPYLFTLAARHDPAVPNTGVAGGLIGPLLRGADLGGMVVTVLLVAGLVALRGRGVVTMGGQKFLAEAALGAAFICAAVNFWGLGPAVGRVRRQLIETYGASYLADKADPLYQRFSALHGASTVIFVIGVLGGVVALVAMSGFYARVSEPTRGTRHAN